MSQFEDRDKNRSTAYSDSRQQKYFEIEDVSWWYLYRERVFRFLIEKYFNNNQRIFDIGGGNGFHTKALQDAGFDVTLIEPTKRACENAKRRGCRSVINLPFQDYKGLIPQFLCTDVMEHIEDDHAFLECIGDKLPCGGMGLLSVPASMSLWSSEDEVDGHFRRYDMDQLKNVILGCDFEVIYSSFCFQFLWLPIYVRRHLMEKMRLVNKVSERNEEEERAITKKQFMEPGGITGSVLSFLERRELSKIHKGQRISFGSSIVCVVKKHGGRMR